MASRHGEGRPFCRNNGLCASTHGQSGARGPMTMKRLGGLAIVIGRRCACLVELARCRTRAAYPYLPSPPREIRKRKEGRERANERATAIVIGARGSANSRQKRTNRSRRYVNRERERKRDRQTDRQTERERERCVVGKETTVRERGTGRKLVKRERERERGRGRKEIVAAMVMWPHPAEPANGLSAD